MEKKLRLERPSSCIASGVALTPRRPWWLAGVKKARLPSGSRCSPKAFELFFTGKERQGMFSFVSYRSNRQRAGAFRRLIEFVLCVLLFSITSLAEQPVIRIT